MEQNNEKIMKRLSTNKAFRLFHVNYNKIDLAYDDYQTTANYDAMQPYQIPSNMSAQDALLVISYINKKVANEHNVRGNSHQGIRLTSQQLAKYNFKKIEGGSQPVVDLVTASGFASELSFDPMCQNKINKWYIPNVTRTQVAEIYKKCGISLY